MNRFAKKLAQHSLSLRRGRAEILQVNVGKLCNLVCVHCHVNAGPKRKEIMARETIDRIIDWLAKTDIQIVDLTGGAPEMIPDFRYFIEQGGEGVFEGSIAVLQLLNLLGYGTDPNLPLHLIYNPVGAFLPPSQAELEADYKRELKKHFGIVFNNLYTVTNLPIGRFAGYLRRNNKLDEYMQLLIQAFNPATINGLMCRNTISVGWRGEVYDCDFNQQLGMQWNNGTPIFLWDIEAKKIENRQIMTGNHCFGCTAGAGSSCGGAIV